MTNVTVNRLATAFQAFLEEAMNEASSVDLHDLEHRVEELEDSLDPGDLASQRDLDELERRVEDLESTVEELSVGDEGFVTQRDLRRTVESLERRLEQQDRHIQELLDRVESTWSRRLTHRWRNLVFVWRARRSK